MTEINKNLRLLRKKSDLVLEIGDDIKGLVLKMIETMDVNKGVGLAAPQIGVMKRIIVIKIDGENTPLVNPTLVCKSKERDIFEEGCLSLPGQLIEIKRPVKIEATALDLNGEKIELKLEGLAARIFQHELDHLNGKLILDRASLFRRVKNFLTK